MSDPTHVRRPDWQPARGWAAFRVKYGNGKMRQALNAAVRAELPGGSLLLDAAERMHVALYHDRGDRSPAEVEEIRKASRLAMDAADALRTAIRLRYGFDEDAGAPDDPASPGRSAGRPAE